ncbi:MAG: TatD family hydrolase [Vicinamibacterales bacterium]
MVDSHCHIAGPEFTEDLPAVIARAAAAGVDSALVILEATDEVEVARAPVVGEQWPAVRFSVGVHPHTAGKFADDPASAAFRVQAVIDAQPGTRALGEIGLDYHYDFSPREAQRAVLRAQIGLARRLCLPMVIHTREAEDDTFRILDEESASDVGGVFHCFTGDRPMARKALDRGFYISLSGIVTFPKALELKAVARELPLERLLIETDSPFLAPVPHRGARNEPAHVAVVAEVIAGLRGVSTSTVAEAARHNFDRLFKP